MAPLLMFAGLHFCKLEPPPRLLKISLMMVIFIHVGETYGLFCILKFSGCGSSLVTCCCKKSPMLVRTDVTLYSARQRAVAGTLVVWAKCKQTAGPLLSWALKYPESFYCLEYPSLICESIQKSPKTWNYIWNFWRNCKFNFLKILPLVNSTIHCANL